MKLINKLMTLISFSVLILLSSCHTDTPTSIDTESPLLSFLSIQTGNDTLYSNEDLEFSDFELTINAAPHKISFQMEDNEKLHKAILFAEDSQSGISYPLQTISKPENGKVSFDFSYQDFPVVQEAALQNFYLWAEVWDKTENSNKSEKMGFKVVKSLPFDKFYQDFGEIAEIDGEMIDFRMMNDKLTIVQFHGFQCGSCIHESQVLQEFYADDSYDKDKFSFATFGSDINSGMNQGYVQGFIKHGLGLEYNCFLDEGQEVKSWFKEQMGYEIGNDVFAVLANGAIVKYDYSVYPEFKEWVEEMFKTISAE